MGAGAVGMAILTPQPDAGSFEKAGKWRQKRKRRAQENGTSGLGVFLENLGQKARFSGALPKAVHFPVAGHQGPNLRHWMSLRADRGGSSETASNSAKCCCLDRFG